jgi:hypothetical protein
VKQAVFMPDSPLKQAVFMPDSPLKQAVFMPDSPLKQAVFMPELLTLASQLPADLADLADSGNTC